MFKKILIANRGEIALRIIRTCKKLNIKTVAVYSDIDKKSMHVYQADEAVCIGNYKTQNSYLNIENIIYAAKITQSDAIHPGYGFLSENYTFAKQTEKNKIQFIGPSYDNIKKMGNKINAITLAKNSDLNCLPFYKCELNYKKNLSLAKKLGFPIIIKATYGGGGKGIRIINNEQELKTNIMLAKKESELSYNKTSLYMEKFIKNARHIEIQIISDGQKTLILGERDCSTQENYQKIIEETPAKNLNITKLQIIKTKCKQLCSYIKYNNIGTIEFLYDNNEFYFIEMNPRLQVEHTITENVTNIDLIEKQIELSYFKKLNLTEKDIKINGHAIECRINLNNPNENKIKFLHIPGGHGIRFDSHIYNGYKIPTNYDKLLGKLITHGKTRTDALKKMHIALSELIIYNINTNISMLKNILKTNNFNINNIQ